MCDGYRHQINFLVANLTEKIDALEAVVIKGAKDEKTILPGISEVQKAMEKYQTGMKTIRTAFESRLHICWIPPTPLPRLLSVCTCTDTKAPPKEKKPKAAAKKAPKK